jgi:hypothetical protein
MHPTSTLDEDGHALCSLLLHSVQILTCLSIHAHYGAYLYKDWYGDLPPLFQV